MSNSKLKSIRLLRPGDLIEIVRGIYSHWAVYIGNGKIIHLGAEPGAGSKAAVYLYSPLSKFGVLSEKASVRVDDLVAVAGQSDVFINNKYDGVLPVLNPEEIVERAKTRLGDVGYNIMTKNCEHFAMMIRYGIEWSSQVYVPPWQTDDTISNQYRVQIYPDVIQQEKLIVNTLTPSSPKLLLSNVYERNCSIDYLKEKEINPDVIIINTHKSSMIVKEEKCYKSLKTILKITRSQGEFRTTSICFDYDTSIKVDSALQNVQKACNPVGMPNLTSVCFCPCLPCKLTSFCFC